MDTSLKAIIDGHGIFNWGMQHHLYFFTLVTEVQWIVHEECIVRLRYAKGTSWAEATSNNEKIKLAGSAAIKLHLSEGIRQSVRKSVNRKFC